MTALCKCPDCGKMVDDVIDVGGEYVCLDCSLIREREIEDEERHERWERLP